MASSAGGFSALARYLTREDLGTNRSEWPGPRPVRQGSERIGRPVRGALPPSAQRNELLGSQYGRRWGIHRDGGVSLFLAFTTSRRVTIDDMTTGRWALSKPPLTFNDLRIAYNRVTLTAGSFARRGTYVDHNRAGTRHTTRRPPVGRERNLYSGSALRVGRCSVAALFIVVNCRNRIYRC